MAGPTASIVSSVALARWLGKVADYIFPSAFESGRGGPYGTPLQGYSPSTGYTYSPSSYSPSSYSPPTSYSSTPGLGAGEGGYGGGEDYGLGGVGEGGYTYTGDTTRRADIALGEQGGRVGEQGEGGYMASQGEGGYMGDSSAAPYPETSYGGSYPAYPAYQGSYQGSQGSYQGSQGSYQGHPGGWASHGAMGRSGETSVDL